MQIWGWLCLVGMLWVGFRVSQLPPQVEPTPKDIGWVSSIKKEDCTVAKISDSKIEIIDTAISWGPDLNGLGNICVYDALGIDFSYDLKFKPFHIGSYWRGIRDNCETIYYPSLDRDITMCDNMSELGGYSVPTYYSNTFDIQTIIVVDMYGKTVKISRYIDRNTKDLHYIFTKKI